MTKKEFALQQIEDYVKDPLTCGYDSGCKNITSDGKMCVAGKNLLPEVREKYPTGTIMYILTHYDCDQSKVFIKESVNVLSSEEWTWLQRVHDAIACNSEIFFDSDFVLFTKEEMEALKN